MDLLVEIITDYLSLEGAIVIEFDQERQEVIAEYPGGEREVNPIQAFDVQLRGDGRIELYLYGGEVFNTNRNTLKLKGKRLEKYSTDDGDEAWATIYG